MVLFILVVSLVNSQVDPGVLGLCFAELLDPFVQMILLLFYIYLLEVLLSRGKEGQFVYATRWPETATGQGKYRQVNDN
jgi:uncharacterized protein YqhQ